MRVSRSGGWTSVIRPHSKRLRIRSSKPCSCLGGRSEVMTTCLFALCSVLKVWKNSSCVRSAPCRNWMSSISRTSIVAVAALERLRLVVADAVDEVVGELLGVHVAHPDAGVEVARVVADRVQQVGLAQPGLAVDEQRVVGLGRRLGDRDGGGVGEPVARADDEGVEGVLRVESRLPRRGRRAGRADPEDVRLQRLGRARPARPRWPAACRGCPGRRATRGPRRRSGPAARAGRAVSELPGLLAPASAAGAGQAGVDGDGEVQVAAELVAERVGQRGGAAAPRGRPW